ncbi:phosphatase PAP2 family protein [Sulfitobacter sp. MF3-043]|uniref:phosphatase PAP2 family protein n=1 Tax=Sulfitobacter sediminivivens TaxID=3252902 RepID=UPI0036DA7F79
MLAAKYDVKDFDHFVPKRFDPKNLHPDLFIHAKLKDILPAVFKDDDHYRSLLGDLLSARLVKDDLDQALSDRDEVLRDFGAEIRDQADSFHHYFYNVLSLHPMTHPKTAQLISLGTIVAGSVGMHCKLLFERARPVQYWPGLLPVLPTPPHPSFPSNHATQAYTVAFLIADALGSPMDRGIGQYLASLADRIAVNREKAGVHFWSDSEAGRRLAQDVKDQLMAIPFVRDDLLAVCCEELADFATPAKSS